MTEGIICERCGDATPKNERRSGLRSRAKVKYRSDAATRNVRREYDLCDDCTYKLYDFLDVELPYNLRTDEEEE